MIPRRLKRTISRQQIGGAGDVLTASYSVGASGLKVSNQFGAEFKKSSVNGMGAIIADTAPAIIESGTAIAIYNNTSSVQWVNMNRDEDGALTAPTGFANAIPLAPNSWTYLNMGENNRIRTSSANVGIYILRDDTNVLVTPAEDPF